MNFLWWSVKDANDTTVYEFAKKLLKFKTGVEDLLRTEIKKVGE